MSYLFTQKEKKEFEQLPAATYEVVIEKIDYKTTSNGKEYLSFSMKIREDIASNNEKYRKWHIFETAWKDVDGQYSFFVLQNLVNTQPRESESIEFENVEEVIKFLTGAYLKVKITYEANKNLETVQRRKYYPTDYKAVIQEKPEYEEIINDNDLPF